MNEYQRRVSVPAKRIAAELRSYVSEDLARHFRDMVTAAILEERRALVREFMVPLRGQDNGYGWDAEDAVAQVQEIVDDIRANLPVAPESNETAEPVYEFSAVALGSDTDDNRDCDRLVEFKDGLRFRSKKAKRTLLSTVLWALEDCPAPKELLKEFKWMRPRHWAAMMRAVVLIFTDMEKDGLGDEGR